jgi:hypothetical protein
MSVGVYIIVVLIVGVLPSYCQAAKGRPDTTTYWPTDRRLQIPLHSTPSSGCSIVSHFAVVA